LEQKTIKEKRDATQSVAAPYYSTTNKQSVSWLHETCDLLTLTKTRLKPTTRWFVQYVLPVIRVVQYNVQYYPFATVLVLCIKFDRHCWSNVCL